MPMFTFKIAGSDGTAAEQQLGLYHIRAATDYARRLSRGARVEIWDDSGLVTAVQDGVELSAVAESSI